MIVVWRVVDSCNLSCPFCAYDKRLAFPRAEIAPDDVLRFAEVLKARRAETGERMLLSWLGGEPLRWAPLRAVTEAVRALGLDVSATTNGSTLGSPALRRHIREAYSELTVSIDGFAPFHDDMRGWPGAFVKLREWIPALAREAGASALRLRANIVLMRQNVGDFARLCRALASWGFTEITFNQLGGRDRPEFYPAHRLAGPDVDQLAAELPSLRRELVGLGATLVGDEAYLSRLRASASDETLAVEDCGPGEGFLFIDEKGRVSPCSFTGEDYGVDVRGLVTAADIADLPRRVRAARDRQRSAACGDCLSTQVCGKFGARAPQALRA